MIYLQLLKKIDIRYILVLACIIVVGYWVNWSMDIHVENEKNKAKIVSLTSSLEAMAEAKDKVIDIRTEFGKLEQSQVDLLCAARYNAPITVVEKPVLQEVIIYRDKLTKCPTLDPEAAEPYDKDYQVLRPINEQIAAQVLDNTWRAYCIATDYKEPSCLRP